MICNSGHFVATGEQCMWSFLTVGHTPFNSVSGIAYKDLSAGAQLLQRCDIIEVAVAGV